LSKIITRLLPLTLLLPFLSINAGAQQQPDRPPILNLGNAVVSGFSGTVAPDPARRLPPNKTVIDLTFINPDAPSARIIDIRNPGFVWDGRVWAAPKPLNVLAKDVGQVFAIALDDDQFAPNIYLGATSIFGLNIVTRGADGLPERKKKGLPGAVWMKGQFGLDLQGGPGSLYKVDGRTGIPILFANVMLDGVPNPGPGLGNIAYDSAHKQLFVSDLYTGMIHRFAILDGSEPGAPYDHGVTGRTAANMPPAPFSPANRLNITNARFDSENPDTWGFAPPERSVWGLAVHEGRLFYSARNGSATEGPQIWSVGIMLDGSFAADPRWELDVPAQPGPYSVSDIAFSQKGAMILAQRAPITASYDYSAFTKPAEPRVLRYWLENPDDPNTPSRWIAVPEEYAVGFAGDYRNTNGGVALGYGYDQLGRGSTTSCEFVLWTTAQNMRNAPPLQQQLLPGGPLVLHGIHAVPAGPVRNFNEPPWVSYSVDYDDRPDNAAALGHMGSVRILTAPCTGAVAAYGGPGYASNPPYIGGGGGGGSGDGCVGPNCNPCVGPNCNPCPFPLNPDGSCGPTTTKACFASTGTFDCVGGRWVYRLTVTGSGGIGINTVSAVSLTPGITIPGGQFPLNPASIPVNGAPGSSAVIEICAFNAAAAASGRPYDCCRTKVTVAIPNRVCVAVRP
jgi:hypothetical protein